MGRNSRMTSSERQSRKGVLRDPSLPSFFPVIEIVKSVLATPVNVLPLNLFFTQSY